MSIHEQWVHENKKKLYPGIYVLGIAKKIRYAYLFLEEREAVFVRRLKPVKDFRN
jgi:hypothetical protein